MANNECELNHLIDKDQGLQALWVVLRARYQITKLGFQEICKTLAIIGLNTNRNGEQIGDTVPLDVQCSPVLHECTKYIELDCHFVGEKIQSKLIFLSYLII